VGTRTTLAVSIVLFSLLAGSAAAQQAPEHDGYAHLSLINRASLVMLAEEGLVERALAGRIARGIEAVDTEQAEPGARRSSNYLIFEERLLELTGDEGSMLHMGRSRQGIGSTLRRYVIREDLLDVFEAMLEPWDALLDLAADHVDTVVPAYTHGVQAQPTSLAHYLLAFADALARDAGRLEGAWGRINRSPMGAAALGTSGFPLDRVRLAELLGFDGVIENSYDANLVASLDSKIELANALSTSAVTLGVFTEDLQTQYHDPSPWILLDPGQTGVSSIMPQKRNPLALENLRALASEVVGDAQTVALKAHNTSTGMADYRPADQVHQTATKAAEMHRDWASLLRGLLVRPERALLELTSDYSTMTEVADVLLREADVPFRVGHHYASELTTFGREHGKTPTDLTPEELTRIYHEAIGEDLPVPVESILDALDPRAMVRNRRGLGGPQPDEVARMLDRSRTELVRARAWVGERRGALLESEQRLAAAFQEISGG
jgi:argininosuccinate lyase